MGSRADDPYQAAERGVSLCGKTPVASVGLALRQVLEVAHLGSGWYEWRGRAPAELALPSAG